MSFKDIKDQPAVVSTLESALVNNRLPHALLFAGPRDAGQLEAAFALTKALFCENRKGAESCGLCVQCRQVDQKSHPDLVVLEPEEDSRFIKIEAVRELIARANLKPFQANSKVFVIDGAERMNETAQNALLKTLEEPEGKTVFILISSSSDELLVTIRSRAQTLYFVPAGNAGETDPETQELQKEILGYLLYGASQGAKTPDLGKVDRETLGTVFDFLIAYFRDALLIGAGAGKILVAPQNLSEKEVLARSLGPEPLTEKIELLSEFKEKILESANVKLALSVLWAKWGKSYAA